MIASKSWIETIRNARMMSPKDRRYHVQLTAHYPNEASIEHAPFPLMLDGRSVKLRTLLDVCATQLTHWCAYKRVIAVSVILSFGDVVLYRGSFPVVR